VASDNLFGSNIVYAASGSPQDFNGYPSNPNTIVALQSRDQPPASGAPVV